MVVTIGYIAGGAIAILSAVASLYFAALILGWTFGLAIDPLIELVHLSVWLVPFFLSVFALRALWTLDQKKGQSA